MRSWHSTIPVLYVLMLGTSLLASPDSKPTGIDAGNGLRVRENSGELRITVTGFEENKGQIRTISGEPAPNVRYRLVQGSTTIYLLENGIAYQFNRKHYPEGYAELMRDQDHDPDKEKQRNALRAQVRLETFRMDMVLEGASQAKAITTEIQSSDYTNYYTCDALDVRSYERITYHDVYPGIDWVIHTTDGGLKYDFVVHPGADPSLIQLRFKDHEELRLDGEGRLIHGNRMGRFTEERPMSFQEGRSIPTRFNLKGERISFALSGYDKSRSVIIDPARIWATYYGGTEEDRGMSCAVDASGNVYMAGWSWSSPGIASAGHQNTFGGGPYDAFLVKFEPDGTRLWGTYYGGAEQDNGYSCAVDAAGNVYLAGFTASDNNIASGGHQNTYAGAGDAFLVKFDQAGTRLWGTYYGGPGGDEGFSCATDPTGNVYLCGYTLSTSAIANGGHQNTFGGLLDAFLVKFDAAGVRLWGTYYGGNADEKAHVCTTDAAGNVYMAGPTASAGMGTSGVHQEFLAGGGFDAFVVKFDAAGARTWGTYYGGTNSDYGWTCAVDPSGNVFLAGVTYSSTGIASGGHQNTLADFYDPFLVKFDPNGVRVWGTYYGGPAWDEAFSCAADANGNVYLAGWTGSASAIASGGYQNTLGGGIDAFLVKFDALGTRLWGTYYGGAQIDYGTMCIADPNGNVYLAGYTQSDSDIASNGHQNTIGGGEEAFLVKFDGAIGTGITSEARTTTTIFPNPTDGQLMITAGRVGQRYVITDVAGRLVQEGMLRTSATHLDLSMERTGVYLLKAWDQGGIKVIRVVKE